MYAADAPDVTSNPIYLYVLLILVIVGLVVSFVAKQVPTVGKTIDGWVARRRRAAKLSRNADLDLLRGQLQNVLARVAELEGREAAAQTAADRHREVLSHHTGWDWEATQTAIRAGTPLPPPPPLYPPAAP